MARIHDKQKAIELRQVGKTYSEIRMELSLSKSTLSGWLRNCPLTSEQLILLQENTNKRRYSAREKTSITKRVKRQNRLDMLYNNLKKNSLPLSNKELFLSGLFLYWGEGGKTERSMISISNTDPGVLMFSLLWMVMSLGIPKEKIQVRLNLYDDMIIEEAIDYWSKTLNMPRVQFGKSYIKKSTRESLSYKGYGHGTCILRVYNTAIKEKILMGMKAMADYSNQYIPEIR